MYNRLATFFASRIGDCLGAITAGLICVIIAHRSQDEAAFIYLGVPLLAAGGLATIIAFTKRG